MSVLKIVMIFVFLTYYSATSYEELFKSKLFQAGFQSSITSVNNTAQMPVVFNYNDCGLFTEGRNTGYQIGTSVNMVHPDYSYSPFLNLFFESRPAFLETNLEDMEVWEERLQAYVPLVRNYQFNSSLKYLGLELGGGWKPLNEYPVGLMLSLDFAYPFISSNYKKTETLISPEGLSFPGGSESRVYESGELPNVALSFGAIGGIFADYEWKNVTLRPKISYRYSLNSLTSSFDWKANSIILSLAVLWDFDLNQKEEPIDTIPEIIPVVEEKIIVVKEEPKPEEPAEFIRYIQTIPLTIRETIVTQTYPLLPYVFFDSASANIKEQYTEGNIVNDEFLEDSLPKSTLGIYYKMLDIVGFRMKQDPTSSITLLGLTDGRELDSLNKRINLAKDRANALKTYIIKNWDIEESRIIIKTQDYPNLPTSEIYNEGFEENRRVELISGNFALLRPVIHSKFIENSSNQKDINLYAGVQDEEAVKSYEINFYKNGNEIYSYHTNKTVKDEYKIRLNKMLLDRIAEQTNRTDTLDVELKLYLTSGESYSKRGKFPVSKSLNQFELGRLNLIVFDFDKSDISKENRFMIDNFVKSSIQSTSKVNIIGSSDILGGEEYNIELSQRRADNTKEYLLEFEKNLEVVKSLGIGSSNLLYDNAKPEGRFYCRTVLIEVNTPFDK